MIIKRESGFDEVSFTLRISNLENSIISEVKNCLKECDFEVVINNSVPLLLVPLLGTNLNKEELVTLIKKWKIPKGDINLFISLTTEFDMSGFSIPESICDFFFQIGGSVDFSYIYTG